MNPQLYFLCAQLLVEKRQFQNLSYHNQHLADFINKIHFKLNFGPVMIFDLPEAYYTLLLKRSFKDQVIVTTTKKNIKNHKVKVLGLGDLLKSKKPTFFKDKLIRKWFFYWMVRGVFSKKDEPLFHFLKFEYHED